MCYPYSMEADKGNNLLQGMVKDGSSTINSIFSQVQFMIRTEIVGVICASKSVCTGCDVHKTTDKGQDLNHRSALHCTSTITKYHYVCIYSP